MPLFKKLTVLAGAAEAARRYARKNPDKAAMLVDQAAQFVDKQTKGKYSGQIRDVAGKVKGAAGVGGSGSQPYGRQRYGAGGNGSAPGYGARADRGA